MVNDEELLKVYMDGFDDELWSRDYRAYDHAMKDHAYIMGRGDAVIGDDVASFDEQSNEDILKRIKDHNCIMN